MILGFSHFNVTLATDENNKDTFLEDGWKLKKSFKDIRSSSKKFMLMQNKNLSHSLFFLKGHPKIELIEYNNCSRKSNNFISLRYENTPEIYCKDVKKEMAFFCNGLGFKKIDDKIISLISPIHDWRIKLKLIAKPEIYGKPYLDTRGPNSMAFYSNSLINDKNKLENIGAHSFTETFDIKIDRRELSIIMMRTPNNLILELIKVKK